LNNSLFFSPDFNFYRTIPIYKERPIEKKEEQKPTTPPRKLSYVNFKKKSFCYFFRSINLD
jgi:hypothetical protein